VPGNGAPEATPQWAPGRTGGARPAPGGPAPWAPSAPTQALGAATATAPPPEAKKPDLSVNKVVAGAGAAAVAAVFGSFFGAFGTVAGAALGSVVSTLASTALQHSLDRTRDTVRARIKLSGGRTVDVEGKVEVPAPPVAPGGETGQARVYVTPGDQPTTVLAPAAASAPAAQPRSRRRLLVLTGLTVAVFALGLLAVTGIELVKGSPLNTSGTSDSGTSVGRVLGTSGGSSTAGSTDTTATTTVRTTTSEAPTTEPRETTEPSSTDEPPATETRDGAGFGATQDAEPTEADTTPTPSPRTASGGGAADDVEQ
jgi:hypothetical protein